MNDIAIQVENLSKTYRIGNQHGGDQRFGYSSLRDVLTEAVASPLRRIRALLGNQIYPVTDTDKTLWALKNISFEVKQGEVVGIIGRNGAGKSTLLKILSRITEPSHGEATLYGRVGSLLEVGTGFHPELTGQENIYLSGAILGMKRAEIIRRFDEIVAFAEVDQFMDTPVKHYSSGMYFRLAFAVAAHLEPEILLVDEVLAVGDAKFQKKCLGKMDDVAKGGRTVLLVSHNMVTISALCHRVLYLADGQVQANGPPQSSIELYLAALENRTQTSLMLRKDRAGEGHVRVTNIVWLNAETLQPIQTVISGQKVYLKVSYETVPNYQKEIRSLQININFFTHLSQFVMVLNSRMANYAFEMSLPASGQLYCYIERFPLMSGRFISHCYLDVNGERADYIDHAFITDVETGDFYGTGFANERNKQGVYVPHQWLKEPFKNVNPL